MSPCIHTGSVLLWVTKCSVHGTMLCSGWQVLSGSIKGTSVEREATVPSQLKGYSMNNGSLSCDLHVTELWLSQYSHRQLQLDSRVLWSSTGVRKICGKNTKNNIALRWFDWASIHVALSSTWIGQLEFHVQVFFRVSFSDNIWIWFFCLETSCPTPLETPVLDLFWAAVFWDVWSTLEHHVSACLPCCQEFVVMIVSSCMTRSISNVATSAQPRSVVVVYCLRCVSVRSSPSLPCLLRQHR